MANRNASCAPSKRHAVPAEFENETLTDWVARQRDPHAGEPKQKKVGGQSRRKTTQTADAFVGAVLAKSEVQ